MEKGILILRLNPYLRGVPDYKKTAKAVRKVKSLLQRHVKSEHVKIGPYLNQKLWGQGRKHPPNKVKIEITKKEDYFLAEIPDAPKPKEDQKAKKGKTGKKDREKKDDDTGKPDETIPETEDITTTPESGTKAKVQKERQKADKAERKKGKN